MDQQSEVLNLGQPVNWSSPLNRGLALWYMPLLGGTRSSRFLDLGGKYHGTLNGPVWQSGRFGNTGSLEFDSATDNVTASIPQIVAPLSILMRVKITSAANNQAFLSHDSGSNNGFRIAQENNWLRFTLGGVGNYTAVAITPVNSQWSTFVITWAGNGGAVNGYHYNHETGVYTSGSDTSGTMSGTPNRITIGWDLFSNNTSMKVADVRIFKRIVTEDQARTLVQDALTGYKSTLNRIRPTYRMIDAPVAGGATTLPPKSLILSQALNRSLNW